MKLDVLRGKKKLTNSQTYQKIMVVAAEESEVRHKQAYLAKKRGDTVWQRHDLIWVNGTKYDLGNIPEDLKMTGKGEKENTANKVRSVDHYEPPRDERHMEGVNNSRATQRDEGAQEEKDARDEENMDWDQQVKCQGEMP